MTNGLTSGVHADALIGLPDDRLRVEVDGTHAILKLSDGTHICGIVVRVLWGDIPYVKVRVPAITDAVVNLPDWERLIQPDHIQELTPIPFDTALRTVKHLMLRPDYGLAGDRLETTIFESSSDTAPPADDTADDQDDSDTKLIFHDDLEIEATVHYVERKATSNSSSPMWLMKLHFDVEIADAPDAVFVIEHSDPEKNSITPWKDHSFYPVIAGMQLGDRIVWDKESTGLRVKVRAEESSNGRVYWRVEKVLDEATAWPKTILNAVSARKDVIEDIKGHIEEQDGWLYLDAETTGTGDDAEIVSLCILNGSGEVLFNELVKPLQPIPDGLPHNITDADVAESKTFAEHWPAIKAILADAIGCVAYNADFDSRILDSEIDKCDPDFRTFDWRCAMKWYAAYAGEYSYHHKHWKWHKLDEACAAMGIVVEDDAHSALGDTKRLYQLVQKMAEEPKNDMPF